MSTLTLSFIDDVGSVPAMSTTPATCTVVVSATGGRCGAPAVSSWTSSRGFVYAECADHCTAPTTDHAGPAAVRHPATRTTKPYVLVARGRIVGYAEALTPAVIRRAAKLGAEIVPVQR